MPCSNCIRYNRQCVVFNDRSQRCGECVRRGARCDVIQASVDDLQSLRMEEERLKDERDTIFETVVSGLSRIRELERRQSELRERGREMLRRGLKTLDELDEAEEKERLEKERFEKGKEKETPGTLFLDAPGPSNASFDASFFDPLDPDDPVWATLGIVGEMPPTSQSN